MDLKQLNEIKERAQKKMGARTKKVTTKVYVALGSCGIAAGAKPVLQAFTRAIKQNNLQNIKIMRTGCKGFCSQEPLAQIETNRGTFTYGKLTPEKVEKIVKNHLIEGKPVQEYLVFTG